MLRTFQMPLVKNSIGVCVAACTGFPSIKLLTCPMDTRAIVYKALFGPRFREARTVLTPRLTDAVMKGVKVWRRLHVSSCTVRVVLVYRISAVQSCREYRNRLL